MTSLIGLLLGTSPHWRQQLARRWAVVADSETSYLIADLYRQITDDWSLRAFIERLPADQLMVLQQVVAEPEAKILASHLLRKLPLDERSMQSSIAELTEAALLTGSGMPLIISTPSDLLVPLRRALRPGHAENALGKRNVSASADQAATDLMRVARPAKVVPANDYLLDDVDRVIDDIARGIVGTPRRSKAGCAGISSRKCSRLGIADGDYLAAERLRLALRCTMTLGLLAAEDGMPQRQADFDAWGRLGREEQARSLYDIWVSDREWHEPMARPNPAARRALRFDRLRQRLRGWLEDGQQETWYSMRSLLTRAGAGRGSALHRQGMAHPQAQAEALRALAIESVVATGFFWLGGVDIGQDSQGRVLAFRLTKRGHCLLHELPAGSARRHAMRVG